MKKIIISIAFIFIFSIFSIQQAHAQTVGETLTGHYTYFDPEGDPEGVSTFQWYRDDVAIPGAISITYLTVSGDIGKTIVFEVTPVALTGISPGVPIRTTGIIITAPVVVEPVVHHSSSGSISSIVTQPTPTPDVINCLSSYLFDPNTGKPCTITSPIAGQVRITSEQARTLKYKMTGGDVKALQVYLNTHNYPVSTTGLGSLGNETTFFGLKTKAAVIKFQLANGLKGDGIVGKLTQAKMK
jgi:hypothetical protein